MKVAIIGGGPIGVEAALYGTSAGFDVSVFERSDIAANVRAWGHVRVFTVWGRNRSPLAIRLLQEQGAALPPDEATSTGDELADYVHSLTQLPPLQNRILTHTEILAVTRQACLKSDFIGDERRAEFPFQLLLRDGYGERLELFDAVIDATGVYATPNWLGSGGAPCIGELQLKESIDYAIPDIAGKERVRFAGKSTLVVGSGHSAASTLITVGDLMPEFPSTKLAWVVRRTVPEHGFPYSLIPNDPSPHRDLLHRRANELTKNPQVDFYPQTVVEKIEQRDDRLRISLNTCGDRFKIDCDNIAAHTGFRPDQTLWRELALEIHPATDAPRRLGEALVEQNRHAGVGLSTGYAQRNPSSEEERANDKWRFEQNDPNTLATGEPNFFVIGIKSYGRDAGFLMQNGFRQVRDVFKLLSNGQTPDQYEGL